MNRREFLLAGTAAAALARRASADPLGMPIGVQTYTVRDRIGADFDGTLRELRSTGFGAIEMCSPPSYTAGFGPLAGMKASEMRQKIAAAGLVCESCHYGFRELKENLPDRIAYARELGLKQMVVSTFGMRQGATLADWGKAGEELNAIGEKTQAAGMQLGYHNHNGEFEKLDGTLIYDRLLEVLDPKLVKLQFQTAVVSMGYQAAAYFRKYPGRFLSMHLADWSAQSKKQVPLGKGEIDWKDLLAAARTTGIKNYFVEMDMPLMRESMPFLKQI